MDNTPATRIPLKEQESCNNPLTRTRIYLRKCSIIQKSTGSRQYIILLGASGFPLREAPLYSEIVICFKEWCIPVKRVEYLCAWFRNALSIHIYSFEKIQPYWKGDSFSADVKSQENAFSVEVVVLEEGSIISKESVYSNSLIKIITF